MKENDQLIQLTNWEDGDEPCLATGFRLPPGGGAVTNRAWCALEAARLRAKGRRAEVRELTDGRVCVFAEPKTGEIEP